MAPTQITGHIYCDNYFEFYFNGQLIAKDPLTFTPHNAVSVSFTWDGVSDKVFAIMCQDFATASGYEYVESGLSPTAFIIMLTLGSLATLCGFVLVWLSFFKQRKANEDVEGNGNNSAVSRHGKWLKLCSCLLLAGGLVAIILAVVLNIVLYSAQLGDGALIAEFSDGTVTSSQWQAFVATHGPTLASESAGCTSTNLDVCEIEKTPEPENWTSVAFTAGVGWKPATEYTADEAGWGMSPSWSDGQCCSPTSPMTRASLSACNSNWDVDAAKEVPVDVDESACLSPKVVFANTKAAFLWGADLKKDNRMLFRRVVPGPR
eukprot:TRINITY_DN47962_c0_g1_i1.p1 TRINITY_DN47962_c0_g1~~TRINITY_DN47962_c0_g1_i1.p1  ORF type:complete len:319 (+),score=31.40 TRINITY_DN47962_c0_g1_i1:68-1024(+)